ncbi:Small-conductance mechanosensitive channel [Alkalispirochaeta americana]|uniref:Small-conductance mechanosensitive channel n=1 Tax=Alkalispirochaeta americana TaxID=159291 RepID=A0A1N6QI76_9SPIO|nr:mechanosensitive ion channel domain-containing protein [Alkalispirochaeta americana]SIQ16333.1 Small-conductance mechanosensitive channel [Alkalispirochaeta americana]
MPYLRGIPLEALAFLIPFAAWLLYDVFSRLSPYLARPDSRQGVRIFLAQTRLPVQLILATLLLSWGAPGLAGSRLPSLIVVAASGMLLHRATGTLFIFLRRQFDLSNPDNLRARRATTQIIVLERIALISVAVLTIAVLLMTIPGIQRFGTSLLASAGVAGLVIGLAAQQSIANVLAGIQIAITQPLRIDDAVVIDGEWGWVEEITLTYVVIRIWDRRRLVVPISYLLQKPFQNWTRTTSSVIGAVTIHADYSVDVEALRKEQSMILAKHPLWDGEVDVVQMMEASDRTVVIRSLMSAANSPKAWDLRCDLRERLIRWLGETQSGALPRQRMRIQGEVTRRKGPS